MPLEDEMSQDRHVTFENGHVSVQRESLSLSRMHPPPLSNITSTRREGEKGEEEGKGPEHTHSILAAWPKRSPRERTVSHLPMTLTKKEQNTKARERAKAHLTLAVGAKGSPGKHSVSSPPWFRKSTKGSSMCTAVPPSLAAVPKVLECTTYITHTHPLRWSYVTAISPAACA